MTEMWITIYNYTIAPMIVIGMMAFPIVIAVASIYPFVKEYKELRKEGYSSWRALKRVFATSNSTGYSGVQSPGYTAPHYHSAAVYQNSATYATDPTYINMSQNIGYYRKNGY